ncbi:hypothetical protein GCM10023188_25270 [Pontibacter saemangeumensis]|uniref:SpoIIAA-like n=1 Tax=Pontibacter saemangeumensis TaxID=1084525 RepID=A0ABP8LR95_9BACT
MRHIKLLTTDFLAIEYNLVDDFLVGNWAGPLTKEDIVDGYEQISLFLKKQFCHKLLDNHLEVQGMWVEQAAWMARDWHPRAEAIGLQYHACVYSRDIYSRLSADQAIRMVEKGIVKGFDTESAAEGWLKAW